MGNKFLFFGLLSILLTASIDINKTPVSESTEKYHGKMPDTLKNYSNYDLLVFIREYKLTDLNGDGDFDDPNETELRNLNPGLQRKFNGGLKLESRLDKDSVRAINLAQFRNGARTNKRVDLVISIPITYSNGIPHLPNLKYELGTGHSPSYTLVRTSYGEFPVYELVFVYVGGLDVNTEPKEHIHLDGHICNPVGPCG